MLFTKFTFSELTAAIMLSKKFNTIITLAFKCKVTKKTGQKKGRADLKARAGTNQPGMQGGARWGGDWRRRPRGGARVFTAGGWT